MFRLRWERGPPGTRAVPWPHVSSRDRKALECLGLAGKRAERASTGSRIRRVGGNCEITCPRPLCCVCAPPLLSPQGSPGLWLRKSHPLHGLSGSLCGNHLEGLPPSPDRGLRKVRHYQLNGLARKYLVQVQVTAHWPESVPWGLKGQTTQPGPDV